MDNNPKLSEMEKGNKGSMKKKSYGKSAEEENRSLLKNGMPDDSMIMTNSSKNKKKPKREQDETKIQMTKELDIDIFADYERVPKP